MTKEELLTHFGDLGLTELQQKEADMFQPVYFFAKNKSFVTCSKCGAQFEMDAYKHLAEHICPHCGSSGHVVHPWRYRNRYVLNLRRNVMNYTLGRSVLDPNVITCRAVYSMYEVYKEDKESDKSDLKVETVRFTDAYYIFIPGEGGYCVNSDYRWYPDYGVVADTVNNPMSLRKSCTSRHNMYSIRYQPTKSVEVYLPLPEEWRRVSKGTPMQYACDFYAKELAHSRKPIELMNRIATWPLSMEQLGKIGFKYFIVRSVEETLGLCKAFNMRGQNLRAMLRVNVSKADLAYIRGGEFSMNVYQSWVSLKKRAKGRNLSLQYFNEHFRHCNFTALSEALDDTPLERIIAYLEKQDKKYPNSRNDLNLYADYIADCVKLKIDLSQKANLFPGNLRAMHGNLSDQIVCEANEKLNKKYKKRYKKLVSEYAYSDEAYSIVVPDRITDLIREGKIQHICVGTYMEKVADGCTDVVYIRRNEELDAPFCTMEIRDGAIVQVRAKCNGVPPEDTMAFVKEFENEKLRKAV